MKSCIPSAQTKIYIAVRVKTGNPLKDEVEWVLVAFPLWQGVQGPETGEMTVQEQLMPKACSKLELCERRMSA